VAPPGRNLLSYVLARQSVLNVVRTESIYFRFGVMRVEFFNFFANLTPAARKIGTCENPFFTYPQTVQCTTVCVIFADTACLDFEQIDFEVVKKCVCYRTNFQQKISVPTNFHTQIWPQKSNVHQK